MHARFTVFESTIDDVIFSGFEGDSVYNNIGDLESSGFEFDIAYELGDANIFFGYSSVDTELSPRADLYNVEYDTIDLNGYEFVGLGNSRGDTWVLGVDYDINTDLNVGINITRVNSLTIETLHQALQNGWTDSLYDLNKPSYTTVDVYGQWFVSNNFKVNLAVTNLFDEAYIDHSSVGDYSEVFASVIGPKEAGRDIRVSVSYDF